ncbi:hypothetical protein ACNJX9_04350 [Bradyrhizobium sp. DASA03076]|uniref:hypothetical protein n=1 Tax=Bradyrhizobium sp. BLXBL-03 TaxID=3395916 RepID=UPI003F704F4E
MHRRVVSACIVSKPHGRVQEKQRLTFRSLHVGAGRMKQDRKTSDDELMQRLLAAIGLGRVGRPQRADLVEQLNVIRRDYRTRFPRTALAARLDERQVRQRREILKTSRAAMIKLRRKWEKVDAGTKHEIASAGLARMELDHAPLYPDEEEHYLALVDPELLEQVLRTMELNIHYYLRMRAADYHKRPIRRLLVEPFLQALHSRALLENDLPLSGKMESFFDWVGVKQEDRPKGVPAISRNLKQRFATAKWRATVR